MNANPFGNILAFVFGARRRTTRAVPLERQKNRSLSGFLLLHPFQIRGPSWPPYISPRWIGIGARGKEVRSLTRIFFINQCLAHHPLRVGWKKRSLSGFLRLASIANTEALLAPLYIPLNAPGYQSPPNTFRPSSPRAIFGHFQNKPIP